MENKIRFHLSGNNLKKRPKSKFLSWDFILQKSYAYCQSYSPPFSTPTAIVILRHDCHVYQPGAVVFQSFFTKAMLKKIIPPQLKMLKVQLMGQNNWKIILYEIWNENRIIERYCCLFCPTPPWCTSPNLQSDPTKSSNNMSPWFSRDLNLILNKWYV